MYKFVLTVLAVFFLTIAVAQTPVDCIEADFNNVVHSAYRRALPNNTPTVSCYVLEDATLEQVAIIAEAGAEVDKEAGAITQYILDKDVYGPYLISFVNGFVRLGVRWYDEADSNNIYYTVYNW